VHSSTLALRTNMVDQRVVELQKSKRDLAEVLLNRRVGDNGQGENAQRPLEVRGHFLGMILC
jgi:hypothetical protein